MRRRFLVGYSVTNDDAVDLGQPHDFEQYSPEADALEAAGDYWMVRTVAIAER